MHSGRLDCCLLVAAVAGLSHISRVMDDTRNMGSALDKPRKSGQTQTATDTPGPRQARTARDRSLRMCPRQTGTVPKEDTLIGHTGGVEAKNMGREMASGPQTGQHSGGPGCHMTERPRPAAASLHPVLSPLSARVTEQMLLLLSLLGSFVLQPPAQPEAPSASSPAGTWGSSTPIAPPSTTCPRGVALTPMAGITTAGGTTATQAA